MFATVFFNFDYQVYFDTYKEAEDYGRESGFQFIVVEIENALESV